MLKNEFLHRERLTEAQVAEVLNILRKDPELSVEKWKILVHRPSKMFMATGPQEGASEKGILLELTGQRDASKQRVLWLTEQKSIFDTE